MTAIGAPNLSICCRSVDSETICPNRQDALVSGSGELELCNEPGSVCSLVGTSDLFFGHYFKIPIVSLKL
jgi:hypothetical protein